MRAPRTRRVIPILGLQEAVRERGCDRVVSSGTIVVFGATPTVAIFVESLAFGEKGKFSSKNCGQSVSIDATGTIHSSLPFFSFFFVDFCSCFSDIAAALITRVLLMRADKMKHDMASNVR